MQPGGSGGPQEPPNAAPPPSRRVLLLPVSFCKPDCGARRRLCLPCFISDERFRSYRNAVAGCECGGVPEAVNLGNTGSVCAKYHDIAGLPEGLQPAANQRWDLFKRVFDSAKASEKKPKKGQRQQKKGGPKKANGGDGKAGDGKAGDGDRGEENEENEEDEEDEEAGDDSDDDPDRPRKGRTRHADATVERRAEAIVENLADGWLGSFRRVVPRPPQHSPAAALPSSTVPAPVGNVVADAIESSSNSAFVSVNPFASGELSAAMRGLASSAPVDLISQIKNDPSKYRELDRFMLAAASILTAGELENTATFMMVCQYVALFYDFEGRRIMEEDARKKAGRAVESFMISSKTLSERIRGLVGERIADFDEDPHGKLDWAKMLSLETSGTVQDFRDKTVDHIDTEKGKKNLVDVLLRIRKIGAALRAFPCLLMMGPKTTRTHVKKLNAPNFSLGQAVLDVEEHARRGAGRGADGSGAAAAPPPPPKGDRASKSEESRRQKAERGDELIKAVRRSLEAHVAEKGLRGDDALLSCLLDPEIPIYHPNNPLYLHPDGGRDGPRPAPDMDRKVDFETALSKAGRLLRAASTEGIRNAFIDNERLKSMHPYVVPEGTMEDLEEALGPKRLEPDPEDEAADGWPSLQRLSPTGVLLFGPPGTGKSQFARELARRIGYSFLEYKPSQISEYYGQAAKIVEAFFDIAYDVQDVILMCDEVDATVPASKASLDELQKQVMNTFATAMDKLYNEVEHRRVRTGDPGRGPIVIAATNYPLDMDAKFFRRFRKHIFLPAPNAEFRREIIKSIMKFEHEKALLKENEKRQGRELSPTNKHLFREECFADVNLDELASDEMSGGFTYQVFEEIFGEKLRSIRKRDIDYESVKQAVRRGELKEPPDGRSIAQCEAFRRGKRAGRPSEDAAEAAAPASAPASPAASAATASAPASPAASAATASAPAASAATAGRPATAPRKPRGRQSFAPAKKAPRIRGRARGAARGRGRGARQAPVPVATPVDSPKEDGATPPDPSPSSSRKRKADEADVDEADEDAPAEPSGTIGNNSRI
eukprot:tig00000411_g505.t1